MERYTPEQRLQIIELYYQNSCSVKNVFRALRPFYGRHKRPTEQAIRDIVTKFRTNYTLLDIEPTSRKRRVCTEENIAAVAASVKEDSELSIRRRSQQLGLCYSTTWKILSKDLDDLKVEESVPATDLLNEEEPIEVEVEATPPVAKKSTKSRGLKKEAKTPASKTKGTRKVVKEPEHEGDVLQEDEVNPEDDREKEQDPIPKREPELKAKKSFTSKGSRKQLKEHIPPDEGDVIEIKDDTPELPDSEEEVKKPKKRKSGGKKPSTPATKNASKKTTKAKKRAKAESAAESVNDDQATDES